MHQGSEVLIARTGTPTCPITMLEEYMKKGNIQKASKAKLFQAIVSGKKEKLRKSGGLSYGRFRALVKNKLKRM